MKNITIAIAFVVSFGLGFIYSSSMTVLPKDISTANTLMVLERGIRSFVAERQRFPNTLSELVESGKVDKNRCWDRWGNEIQYSAKSNIVSLVSSGDPSITRSSGIEYRISNTFSINRAHHEEKDRREREGE